MRQLHIFTLVVPVKLEDKGGIANRKESLRDLRFG
jgi:hypothetical protein